METDQVQTGDKFDPFEDTCTNWLIAAAAASSIDTLPFELADKDN